MRHLLPALYAVILAAGVLPMAGSTRPTSVTVREERTVIVNGVREIWQLVWIGAHSGYCKPPEEVMPYSCPCAGFAYGEVGKLLLVRRRNGRAFERMDLGPLFAHTDFAPPPGEGRSILQHWPMKDSDIVHLDPASPQLLAEIEKRPATAIMTFADYDNDGQATEFLLQVDTLPCGKLQYAAVGISAGNPRLHALRSLSRPRVPLTLPVQAWQALKAARTSTSVRVWDCGDHGSEVQSDLIVSARRGRIAVKARDTSCAVLAKQRRLGKGAWNGTG